MKTIVVTGANRGLGLASAQKLMDEGNTVIFATRHPEKVKVQFKNSSTAMKLDVANPSGIDQFAKDVLAQFKKVDVLVNNAGIFIDGQDADTILKTFQTNTLGAALMIQKFLPTMVKNNFGRIVNVSSGMGQLSEMAGGYLSYRVSKTALNAVTRVYAAETQGKNILINSICPGWVKTDMGGAGATRTIEEGIYGILWAATLPDDGPTGGFFRDGKAIDW
jgi:NAD(P)-dependent dehydrogenase (short-subunit alcohol dehydrogenase family)